MAWIKETYADQRLCVKTLSEPDFMKHLELAIQFGTPFLFENVDEELDPMLDPVLEKNVVQDGSSKTIVLGDKVRSHPRSDAKHGDHNLSERAPIGSTSLG